MAPTKSVKPIAGYLEIASPQILDDRWRELKFDIASGHNVLQDLVGPETAAGYVYRESHVVGSATHNRFIYWRTTNDILELVELSSEIVLDDNQVRIRFTNAPVIESVYIIELSDSVAIMVATTASVHRLHLTHPKTTSKSILHDLTNDVLFNPANYYVLHNSGYNSQQPICASSWEDKTMLKCALSFPNSSLLVVQFGKFTHHVSTFEIKQVGIIGRLWSRMPNLLARNPNDCDNAVFVSKPYHQQETDDILLFTLCRDCRIRVFSTNTRECVLTHNMIPQSSFSQSFSSHTNPTTELPMMKMLGSHVLIYLTEGRPEFTLLTYVYEDGTHMLRERLTIHAPTWEKLIDFSVNENKIWALAFTRETESTLSYIDLKNFLDSDADNAEEMEGVWDYVNLEDDTEAQIRDYHSEIFWHNRFSVAAVQKALAAIIEPKVELGNDMQSLESLASVHLMCDESSDTWARFYNYCLQNHMSFNKTIGLVVSPNEAIVSILKRSNPSFVVPWMMSVDMVVQPIPYRGIEFSTSLRGVIEPLNYISNDLMTEEASHHFDKELYQNPSKISHVLQDIAQKMMQSQNVDVSKLNFTRKNLLEAGIDVICDQLDLTSQASEYDLMLSNEASATLRSEHTPLASNSGIIIIFELFKRIVRARMTLARDLLIYIHLLKHIALYKPSPATKFLTILDEDLCTSAKVRRLLDCLRSYAMLLWITESPIKTKSQTPNDDREVIEFLSTRFRFFSKVPERSDKTSDSTLESALRQNLLMNFLVEGGHGFLSPTSCLADTPQTLSNSHYATEITLNLCRLLWPKSNHLCFAEFLFTQHLDSHLNQYLDLANDWLVVGEHDRYFLRASNHLLQYSASDAADIFNRLWMHMTPRNLVGRFIELDKDQTGTSDDDCLNVSPTMIHRYYDKLIQLFQLCRNHRCLVKLINSCMGLLDGNDQDQQYWINCFRAKLFQYYLELEEPDEAYNTVVLTSDPSLRTNCLRKFVVYHCEREQWSSLLSYPFIGIKDDFIDTLIEKANSSDLSKLSNEKFYKTSYYDLLFASYVSDEEFKNAAEIMYSYAQRLAQEVPGITSIRKQADCLLTSLSALKCVPETDAYIEFDIHYHKEDGRSSVLKRAYDCESEMTSLDGCSQDGRESLRYTATNIDCKEIEMKYELLRARLKLLEKDQTTNAIALSPLRPEEIISQLVGSSLFATARDLAILFKAPMEPILEGLAAKYIFLMGLSSIDIVVHQDIERGLSEIFTDSYSDIDTYNFIANSTSSFIEKLWRFIDYYLNRYDGIGHRYSTKAFSNTFGGSTVLLRIVATKLLSAGYDVPASLRRMYMSRNPAELLKLLIKYDKLIDAAELASEMTDKLLEPANTFSLTSPFSLREPPPVYLPTHLILLLISFLKEDATKTSYVKTGDVLGEKLVKFRNFVKSS